MNLHSMLMMSMKTIGKNRKKPGSKKKEVKPPPPVFTYNLKELKEKYSKIITVRIFAL